jgi:hypothetical protein
MLKLKKLGFLDTHNNTHYSIIHIINWDTYQPDSKKGDNQKDNQRTTKGHIQTHKEHGEYKYSPTQKETSKILPHGENQYTERYKVCSRCGRRVRNVYDVGCTLCWADEMKAEVQFEN